ncbi:MAG: dynamin family protein [Spirochaetes bacterium]|nr:dynamin family protein [Spirochaetota bacterium]
MEDKIIGRLTAYENVISQFEDVIADDADVMRKDCGIISAEKMKAHLAGLDEKGRLLNIGIIGRVKAGKSSLLNSIFFDGKQMLPKAATPMTAALTLITYGDSFSATVEYFNAEDRAKIEKEHADFKRKRSEVYEEKKKAEEERAAKRREEPDRGKIERQTNAAMNDNPKFASWDQYERMKKSKAPAVESEALAASSQEELMGKLNDYVGSAGTKTAYTKSAEIRFPDENLRDIRIVDTPGINDPVESRVVRTNEYLKECDVVFVVSPSGQFITKEDMDLMDTLTAKEGVRQLYLVASQADNQLHGWEVLENSKRDLSAAIQKLNADLTKVALGGLSALNKNNPETVGQFDQLINDGVERVMITSAICHAMHINFDNKKSWDNDMNHHWGLLNESYPANFTSDAGGRESLKLLSGIEKVSEKIALARKEKDGIIAKKKDDYTNAQLVKIQDFSQKLVQKVKERIDRLNKTDKAMLEQQKKNTEKLFAAGTSAVDGTFEDCVDDFKRDVKKIISEKGKTLFAEAANKTDSAEKSETRTGYNTRSEPIGIAGRIARFFGATEFLQREIEIPYNYEVRTLRTGIITSAMNELAGNLEAAICDTVEETKNDWKKTVQRKVVTALSQATNDPDIIDIRMLTDALRRVVNNMELPNLDLGSNRFKSSFSGTIEGGNIDRFMDEMDHFVSNLKTTFNKERDAYLSVVEKSAKRENMSAMLFSGLKSQLENLGKDLENKEATLDRLAKCSAALEGVS